MRDLVKKLARRSKTAIIVYKIFDNSRFRRRIESGVVETIHGSTHLHQNVTQSIAYIERQFADYLNYAALSPASLQGRRILELGPGDNLGVALKFLAAGAKSIVCLDRFYSKRNTEYEKKIYQALRETLNPLEKSLFDEAISLNNEVQFNPLKIQTIYGVSLERFSDKLINDHEPFDLILSCAVLEEIYDPTPTFASMDKLLTPGGSLIHKIDLGDYGMFRNQGMHPLTFLTISERIYKRMASDSGLPNRKRFGYYVETLKTLGYQSKVFVTSVLPAGYLEPAEEYAPGRFQNEARLVADIRHRLAPEFKALDDEELLIDGVLLVAIKPL